MRNAILLSAGLHLSFLLVVLVGLPELFKPDPLLDRVIPVQVVMDQPKDEPKPEEPKKEEPPPPPAPQQAALPEPPEPEAEPIPEPLPKPKPKKPEPKPEKKVEPKAKPKPKPKPQVAKPKPKPAPKPQVAKVKPKPKPDDFQALLKNLAAQSKQNRRKPPEPVERKVADASDARVQMTAMELRRVQDMLAEQVKRQITPCWNIPIGAKDVHQMHIGIRIYLNPDGTLRGAPRIEDATRMRRDPVYQVLAESAVRALQNPRCSPLKLPHDKYDIWQEISFNFDPREALE